MKINKIVCDACKKEIDVEKDSGLAAFEYIEAKTRIDFSSDNTGQPGQIQTEKDIIKTSLDLCKTCADLVVEFIEKKQKESEKNKEVDEDKKE